MSKQEYIIKVSPPDNDIASEKFYFNGYKCPTCNGQGYFIEEIGRDEFKAVECCRCSGTGKVRAEVSVRWLPDEY